MPGSFASLYYHIAFGTKDRRPLITPDLAAPLHNYMAGIIQRLAGRALATGGTADHVHILAALDKDRAVSAVIRDLKANSSRWVHETYPEHADFGWQEGYGAFTVSVRGLDSVRAYIARQEEHHRTVSFRDELASFLREHGIPYDERYV